MVGVTVTSFRNFDLKKRSWLQKMLHDSTPQKNLTLVLDQGNLLWKLYKSRAYASEDVDESSPACSTWHVQADHAKIIHVSLTSKHAWYLTQTDICVQMYLPDMGISHQTDCVFRVHSLTASDHAVWALRSDKNTLITRTGIDPQICPMGVDWVEDSLGGPTTFVSIALHDKTGFGIDTNGYLWFVNGVDEKNPLGCGCWFQVGISEGNQIL